MLKELPEAHKTTFRYIIRFLHYLLRDNNTQNTPSIAHIFGSVLVRSEYNLVGKSQNENPNRDELSITKKKTTFIFQFLTNAAI